MSTTKVPVTVRITPQTQKELYFIAQLQKIPQHRMKSYFFQTLVARECKSLYQGLKDKEVLTAKEKNLLQKMGTMYGCTND